LLDPCSRYFIRESAFEKVSAILLESWQEP
jgi:hypothetical protein